MTRRDLLRAGVLGSGAVGIAVLAHGSHRFAFTGSPVTPRPAPALALSDDEGGQFDLAQQLGRLVLVYFGYIACPDVCPTTLGALAQVRDQMGQAAARVRTVFVTLDPARDTAAVLRPYLANFADAAGQAPLGLTDTTKRVADTARAWDITWRHAEGMFIDHSSVVTVVAPDGTLALRYGFSQLGEPASVARDLRHVLEGA